MLVVDDCDLLLKQLKRTERGLKLHTASSADEVWSILDKHDVGFAIVDMYMPDLFGIDLVRQMRATGRNLMIAAVSGDMTMNLAHASIGAGADDFAPKPFSVTEIVARLLAIAHRVRLEENAGRISRSRVLADWEYIRAVLADCNGNISASARRLGITRQGLQQLLKKPRPRA